MGEQTGWFWVSLGGRAKASAIQVWLNWQRRAGGLKERSGGKGGEERNLVGKSGENLDNFFFLYKSCQLKLFPSIILGMLR